MTFFTSDTQVSRIFVRHFEFSLKTADPAARLLLSCAYDLPRGGGGNLAPLLHRKLINCLLKRCEMWKKGQFKHWKLLIYQNKKITWGVAQSAKRCSKGKKWLAIREVAKKLPSNLLKALTRAPQLKCLGVSKGNANFSELPHTLNKYGGNIAVADPGEGPGGPVPPYF